MTQEQKLKAEAISNAFIGAEKSRKILISVGEYIRDYNKSIGFTRGNEIKTIKEGNDMVMGDLENNFKMEGIGGNQGYPYKFSNTQKKGDKENK